MNTSQIKTYAPKDRTEFIHAITERAAGLGIHGDHMEPVQFQGDLAIIGDKAVSKTEGQQKEKLVQRVKQAGFEMFIRASAYTWFNRFVAIRFMELHDFLDHGYRGRWFPPSGNYQQCSRCRSPRPGQGKADRA